ncbi:MAG: hypothetical protein JNL19_12470 [Burkholderiales bacterium]|nr:hypothetical protein [Burkholderiales bacterium]
MYTLRIDATWAKQIATLRDATSDDTNLIRFDNGFYRVCRGTSAQVMVQLVPDQASAADVLSLQIGTRDFYVATIAGRSFGRYASTIDRMQVNAHALNSAVREVRTATGDRLFELQSMLVFCVAESIRSDLIAQQIDATIRASLGTLRGPPSRLAMGTMLPQARAWGQSSDAVWAAISPEARRISQLPYAARSLAEQRFSERVNEDAIDAALRMTARGVKVLKRPG